MHINSPVLPWLLGGAAAAVLVLIAAGLPRVRHRWAAVAVRTGEALTLTLLTLLTFGTVMNNQYVFYTSWEDLAGSDNSVAQTVVRGANGPVSAHPRPHVMAGPRLLRPLADPGKREQSFQVKGRESGVQTEVIVRLPAGYDPKARSAYPVLVMLSGYPGAPRGNFRAFDLHGSWDGAVSGAGMRAPIIVMPQVNTPRNSVDTECIDDPTGRLPKTETWLGRDLPRWIADHFRVSANTDHWATIGFSYGGWCAAQLAMLHPDVYGGAVVVMGYFAPNFYKGAYNPMTIRPELRERYDLVRVAGKRPPPVSMLLMSSRNDPAAYPQQVRFLASVRAPMSVTSVVLASGGHRVDVIPPQLPRIATWLKTNMTGFRA